ncbi:hypothetical protein FC70_GL000758 [Paucilactobacillus oligofermentans DSM 15707 = LMG 22743]|uniref:Uncharacterized protein n=1 Tax=Paucilactobacillus oligofermentans DSM 15707 = LMG 22743 TaxID=1423778 RepID=A0A0R1RK63_9LACO|nr:cytochrome b/b6 domain-containing protein [Paucilactobacillus oligofermentans]KRL55162.1 hypothetical protein FC70_GL000758 [Paucilactobacillus oligofermentans DSM 15707 = LMG 22743]CUS25849.1 Uncharacterized protein LACOL_0541 [Paucilactobacillus oligofermentans DSM 15707 = LMG 22743]
MKKNNSQLYTDDFFDKGHMGLKTREGIVVLISWIVAIVPITITILSFTGFYHHEVFRFWKSKVGIYEIHFFGTILFCTFLVAGFYAITMAILQNHKRNRVVDKWPTYDPNEQIRRRKLIRKLMNDQFGADCKKYSYYRVEPDQNLDDNEFLKLFKQGDQQDD